jgi:hypothetical protein
MEKDNFGAWHTMLVGAALVIIGALLMLAWIKTGEQPDYTMTDAQARAYCTWHAEDDYSVSKIGSEYVVNLQLSQTNSSLVYRANSEGEARSYISGALDAR